jgi:energy-coupling factor transport system permease protein
MTPLEIPDAALESPLGQTSPVVKLAVSVAWLVALAFTLDPRPPLILAAFALVAGLGLGRIQPSRLLRALAPLVVAAGAIGLFNALLSSSNGDPAAASLIVAGPLRVSVPAASTGVSLAARIVAIAGVGVVFSQTTDSTRLVDGLVRQARLSPRFGYGALAAYQAIPGFGRDLGDLRAARRIRGLGTTWHPRILVGLLVRAIRHGDALALAMDARGFGSGPRTWFRELRWGPLDLAVGLGGAVALAIAFAAMR